MKASTNNPIPCSKHTNTTMATNTQTTSPAVAALSMAVIDDTPFDTARDKRWLDNFNKTCEFIAGHGFLTPWKTVHGTIQRADGKIKPFKMGNWVGNQTECFDGRKGFATMSEHRRNAFQLIMQIDRHPSHPKHRARMSQPKEQCLCPFTANCNEGKPFSSQVALKAHLQSIHVDECVNLDLNWLCNLFPAPAALPAALDAALRMCPIEIMSCSVSSV